MINGTNIYNMTRAEMIFALQDFCQIHRSFQYQHDDALERKDRSLRKAVDIFCGGIILLTAMCILILAGAA